MEGDGLTAFVFAAPELNELDWVVAGRDLDRAQYRRGVRGGGDGCGDRGDRGGSVPRSRRVGWVRRVPRSSSVSRVRRVSLRGRINICRTRAVSHRVDAQGGGGDLR